MEQSMKRLLSILLSLVLLLALLPASVSAKNAEVIYLKPNDRWLSNGARFAAYFYSYTSDDSWFDCTDADGDGIYEVAVPTDCPYVIFCRMDPNTTANNWNNKWNQTLDLTIPTADNTTTCYVVADGTWDKGNGLWVEYAPASPVQYSVAGDAALCGSAWNPSDINNMMTDEDGDGIYTKIYTAVAAGSYEFKVTDCTWSNSWGDTATDENYKITLSNKSDVTISFNTADNTITVDIEPVVLVNYTYTVTGGEATITKYDTSSTDSVITVPSKLGGYPVTTIGAGAFSNAANLTSVTLPDCVTTLKSSAFSGCSNLQSIDGKGIKIVDGEAFYFCGKLTSLTISGTPEKLARSAFSGCNSLVYNEYGGGQYLGNSDNPYAALMDTTSTKITTFTVHPDTTLIAYSVFYGYTSLKSVTLGDKLQHINPFAFYNCSSLTSITIPDSVRSIGVSTFDGCTNLVSVKLPANLTTITSYVFDGCTKLSEITIPDRVTCIEYRAFYNCYALTLPYLPDCVTSIGEQAFYNCSRQNWNIYDNCKYLGTKDNPYAYLISAETTDLTEYTLHENTKLICDAAFKKCSSMEKINLNDKIMAIGCEAFVNCSSLKEFVLPEGFTTIEYGTFSNCTALTTVQIPESVTLIDERAFNYCTSLENITLPGGKLHLADYAFSSSEIKHLSIHGDTSIINGAFSSAHIDRVTIIDGTTNLCKDLLAIPADLIVVPASVTSVEDYAFYKKKNVFFFGDAPTFSENAFYADYYNPKTNAYTVKYWSYAVKQNYGGSVTWYSGADSIQYRLVEAPIRFYKLSESIEMPEVLKIYHIGDTDFTFPFHDAILGEYDTTTGGKKSVAITADDKTLSYEFVAVDPKDVEVSVPSYVQFSCNEVAVLPTVSCYGIPLVLNRDYRLEYQNTSAVGNNATVTVVGLGFLQGRSITKTFSILKGDIASADVNVSSCNYTAKPVTPSVTVKMGDVTLTNGVDYVLNYTDNVYMGTGTVQIMGIGNYTGVRSEIFSIQSPSSVSVSTSTRSVILTEQSLSIDVGDQLYCGYYIYQNGQIIASNTCGVTSRISVFMDHFAAGAYVVEYYTQGYSYIVQGGQYRPYPTGSQTTRAITVTNRKLGDVVFPSSITPRQKEINFRTLCLFPVANNGNADLSTQTWESSDPSVASVDNGILTLNKAGNVNVTVTLHGLRATWDIQTQSLNIQNAFLGYDAKADAVYVIYENELLVEGQDYTLKREVNGKVATVTVTGIGLFGGTVTQQFMAHGSYSPGDINGDGYVNMGDLSMLYAHIKGTNVLTNETGAVRCDISGDGFVNMGDFSMLYAHIKGTNKLY